MQNTLDENQIIQEMENEEIMDKSVKFYSDNTKLKNENMHINKTMKKINHKARKRKTRHKDYQKFERLLFTHRSNKRTHAICN